MQRISFYLFYGFIWLLTLLPLRVLYFFSDLIYIVIYRVAGYRKKVVFQNLRDSFPEKSEKEIEKIASDFYKHFCDHFIESFKALHLSKEKHVERFKYVNPEIVDKYYEQGKSVIAFLGHYGNWEWLQVGPLFLRHKFVSIYRPQKNIYFDRLVNKLRGKYGNEMIPNKTVLRRFVQFKKEGIPFFSLFLGDQSPLKTEIQYWMKFLNQDTPVLLSTEKMARKLDFAVVYVDVKKISRGYYEVELIDVEGESAKTKDYEITRKCMRILEEKIYRSPELWLWTHRRWKHKHLFNKQKIENTDA